MGLFSSMKSWVSSRNWVMSWFKNFASSSAGETITPESALRVSAYFAAIRNISEDIGKLPLIVYEQLDNGTKRRARDSEFWRLLHDRANSAMSSQVWREIMLHDALGWGIHVSEIEIDARGEAVALWPISPDRIQIRRINRRGDLEYDVQLEEPLDVGGQKITTVTLPADQAFVLHGVGPDGIQGYSIATQAAEILGVAIAQDKFTGNFYRNGTVTSGVMEVAARLSPDQMKEIRRQWRETYQGPDKAGEPIIAHGGTKFTPISVPLKDAQFIQSREFTVIEIARWFRMPPHKIGHLQGMTYNNMEQQNLMYVNDTLMPWITRIEHEIKNKIIGDKNLESEILVTAILRGDAAARSNYYRAMQSLGALSPNDIRRLENMDPIDDPAADEYYMQSAMATLANVATGMYSRQGPTANYDDETDDETDDDEQPDDKTDEPTQPDDGDDQETDDDE